MWQTISYRHDYKWLASQTAINQQNTFDCYDLKFKEVDTDHPHLVNFPWRAVPHGREDEPPHGPLRLRPPGPPWDPHGLGAHLLGHEPLLHAHVQPTQNIQKVLIQGKTKLGIFKETNIYFYTKQNCTLPRSAIE